MLSTATSKSMIGGEGMSMVHDAKSYYMDIQQQVDEIYHSCIDSHKIEERTRLQEILRLSNLFCQVHPEYLELSMCVKSLVQEWDKDPLFKKDQIKQRHSFVIVNRSAIAHIYDLSENRGIVSLLYDYERDLDDRIIVIVINDNLSIRKNLCGILHEVGHYIGCRQRSKDNQIDRVQYFIELSLQTVLREVFFYACSQLLEQPIRDYSVLNNPSYSCEKQRIMLGIITCLSDNDLYHWIYRQLADRVTQIRNECTAQPLYLHAYSKAIISAINTAFHDIFTESGNELRDRLLVVANKYSLHPDTTGPMMEALDHISHSEISAFIENVGKLLEEVAADVFMVRALDMRNHYLDRMLSSFDNQYANSKNIVINDLMVNTIERTRLSCIQAACMRRWPVPIRLKRMLAWMDKQRFLFMNKEETYQVKKKLIAISEKQNETMLLTPRVNYISYGGAQRVYSLCRDWATDCIQTPHDDENRVNNANRLCILNPSMTLSKYVHSIMNDPRYDLFLQKKENSGMVKRLRAFGRRLQRKKRIKSE